ncbi:hypothetical protein GGQ60_003321 [Pedobacter zeae]|uniref:Uncharacterized protein n=1 Tax=Pedobacter zeae TaxID=1737356 RepID=A0A7W6P6M4_9SPHI|nr:hypothetical protein [Pedobacter zeae]
MSNGLKYIAVKNDYYSGKTFDSASVHNTYLDMNNGKSGFVFITPACYRTQNWV